MYRPLISLSLLLAATAAAQSLDIELPYAIEFSEPSLPYLAVTMTGTGLPVRATLDAGTDGSAAPSWISLRLSQSIAPATVWLTVDPSKLAPGTYSARVVAEFIGLETFRHPVHLTVLAVPPRITVEPASLSFQGSAPLPGALLVRNIGGFGPQPVNASVTTDSSWLTVTQSALQTNSTNALSVAVSANSASLDPAQSPYQATVTVTSTSIFGTFSKDIPVTMIVNPSGPVLSLGATGAYFTAKENTGTSDTASIPVLDIGDSPLSWNAKIVAGGDWLALKQPGGIAAPNQAGSLDLSVSKKLAANTYFGLVQVSAPGAVNSPQYAVAVLNVTGAQPDATAKPGGLLFVAGQGKTAAAQKVRVLISSDTPADFTVSTSGEKWLAAAITIAKASSGKDGEATVSVNTQGLAPDFYVGTISVGLPGRQGHSVTVLLVVQPPGSCSPTRLKALPVGFNGETPVVTGAPVPFAFQLVDNCGKAVNTGQLIATFSNEDPALPLNLTDAANGVFSGTWIPTRGGTMTTAFRAAAPGLTADTIRLMNTIGASKGPVVLPNNTRNVFNPVAGAPLAPGSLAQITGINLAADSATADPAAPPMSLAGTSATIGGLDAPVMSVGPVGVLLQAPAELPTNGRQTVVVNVKGALAIDTIVMAAAAPAMDPASVVHAADGTPVTADSPATAGEMIAVTLTGMGATDPAVKTGQTAPTDEPLARLTANLMPAITMDGQPVTNIDYAGLTPGAVGTYLVRFTVPDGVSANATLVVQQNLSKSNSVMIPIQAQ